MSEDILKESSESLGGAAGTDNPALLDFELGKLISAIDGDRILAKEMCDIFLLQVCRDLDELAAALAAGRKDVLARVAHRLKGAAASVYASRISALATDIELGGDGMSEAQLSSHLLRIREAFDDVRQAMATAFDGAEDQHPPKASLDAYTQVRPEGSTR